MAYPVVLDANVIYGIETTDFLLWMAGSGLFRPYWSPQILEEVRRNLAERHDLDADRIEYRLSCMNEAIPDAMREIPVPVIEAMPVNPGDRHVLALAVITGCETIVTDDIGDFPPELLAPFKVEAITADEFVVAQVDLHEHKVTMAIDAMAAAHKQAPNTAETVIARLERYLPQGMAQLRALPPS